MKLISLATILLITILFTSCNKKKNIQRPFEVRLNSGETKKPLSEVPLSIYNYVNDETHNYENDKPIFSGASDANGVVKISEKIKSDNGFVLECSNQKYQFIGPEYDFQYRIFVKKDRQESWNVQMVESGNLELTMNNICGPEAKASTVTISNTSFSLLVKEYKSVPCGNHTYKLSRLPFGNYSVLITTSQNGNVTTREEKLSINKGETKQAVIMF